MFNTLLFRVQIFGESCWPELVPGKSYFASRLRRPRTGDYVVFPDPTSGGSTSECRVKKIKHIDGDTFHVGGTVSWASSQTVSSSDILGTILKKR